MKYLSFFLPIYLSVYLYLSSVYHLSTYIINSYFSVFYVYIGEKRFRIRNSSFMCVCFCICIYTCLPMHWISPAGYTKTWKHQLPLGKVTEWLRHMYLFHGICFCSLCIFSMCVWYIFKLVKWKYKQISASDVIYFNCII